MERFEFPWWAVTVGSGAVACVAMRSGAACRKVHVIRIAWRAKRAPCCRIRLLVSRQSPSTMLAQQRALQTGLKSGPKAVYRAVYAAARHRIVPRINAEVRLRRVHACTVRECCTADGSLSGAQRESTCLTPLSQGGSSGGGGAGDNSDNKLDEYVEALKKGGVVRARP
jgi:uncharacterized membrane protein YgcG